MRAPLLKLQCLALLLVIVQPAHALLPEEARLMIGLLKLPQCSATTSAGSIP